METILIFIWAGVLISLLCDRRIRKATEEVMDYGTKGQTGEQAVRNGPWGAVIAVTAIAAIALRLCVLQKTKIKEKNLGLKQRRQAYENSKRI